MGYDMKSRGIKFHILLWSMVILFGAYLGVSLFVFPQSNSGLAQPEITIPDTPNIDADTTPSGSEDTDKNENQKVPTSAIPLIRYAIDLYNNGEGSLSYGTYIISNEGKLPQNFFVPGLGGLTVSGTQYAAFKTTKNKTESLEESYFYYKVEPLLENLLVSQHLLRFGYRAINVEETLNKVTCVETNATSINKGDATCANWKHDLSDSSSTKRQYNLAQAENVFKVIYSRDFPVEINDKNSRVVSRNTLKDPQYQFITISFDVSKLPPELSLYYKANGGLQDVKYTSYTYEFKISQKTGRLAQMIRTEEFTSYAMGGIVEIHSKATFIQNFYAMDKQQTVAHVYDEWPK